MSRLLLFGNAAGGFSSETSEVEMITSPFSLPGYLHRWQPHSAAYVTSALATRCTANGDRVGGITDPVSGVSIVQSSASFRAVYKTGANGCNGYDVARFGEAAATHVLRTVAYAAAKSQPITIYEVIKSHDTTTQQIWLDGIAVGNRMISGQRSTAASWRNAGSDLYDTNNAQNGSWGIHTTVYNGAASRHRRNGRESFFSAGSNTVTGWSLGADYGSTNPGTFSVADIYIFQAAHTPAQVDAMEQFLSRVYGIPTLKWGFADDFTRADVSPVDSGGTGGQLGYSLLTPQYCEFTTGAANLKIASNKLRPRDATEQYGYMNTLHRYSPLNIGFTFEWDGAGTAGGTVTLIASKTNHNITDCIHCFTSDTGATIQSVQGSVFTNRAQVVYGSPLALDGTDYTLIMRRDPADPNQLYLHCPEGTILSWNDPLVSTLWGNNSDPCYVTHELESSTGEDESVGLYAWAC